MSLFSDLEHELDSLKWKRNYDRKNVTDEKSCQSMAFGVVMRRGQGYIAAAGNREHPKLFGLLKHLSTTLGFECTSFTVNKNLLCLPHTDSHNIGPSVIVGLGSYSGGEFVVEGHVCDINHAPVCFDGSRKHWTMPFVGTRYSVVLYTIGRPPHLQLIDE
jgi:hypothetical protein